MYRNILKTSILPICTMVLLFMAPRLAYSAVNQSCDELNNLGAQQNPARSTEARLREASVDWQRDAEVLKKRSKIIREKNIALIFPSTERVRQINQSAKRTTARPADVRVYDRLFDSFMDLSENGYLPQYGGRSTLFEKRPFRNWLAAKYGKPYLPIERDTIDTIFKPGHFTFEQVVSFYYDNYVQENKLKPGKLWVFIRLGSEKPVVVALRRAVKSKIIVGLLGIISARLTFDLGGAFIERGTSPLTQVTRQFGNAVGAGPAQAEFTVINFLEKESAAASDYVVHLKDAVTGRNAKIVSAIKENEDDKSTIAKSAAEVTLEMRTTPLSGLSEKQRKEMLFAWNERYLHAVLAFGKGLPQDYGAGRNMLYDWQYGVAKDHAGAFSIHEDLYINAQNYSDTIEARVKAEKRQPNLDEQKLLARYAADMDFATHSIAQNFLAYESRRIQFFEVATTGSGPETPDKAVQEAFLRSAEVIGFEKMIPAYADEMQRMIGILDPGIPHAQQLATAHK